MFKDITNKVKGIILLFAIASLTITSSVSYFNGKSVGKEKERASWQESVDKAKDRAGKADTDINAGSEEVKNIVDKESKKIIIYDQKAILKVAQMEIEIKNLLEELDNAKETGQCVNYPIPDNWRMQHNKLDSILQGVSNPRLKGGN